MAGKQTLDEQIERVVLLAEALRCGPLPERANYQLSRDAGGTWRLHLVVNGPIPVSKELSEHPEMVTGKGNSPSIAVADAEVKLRVHVEACTAFYRQQLERIAAVFPDGVR